MVTHLPVLKSDQNFNHSKQFKCMKKLLTTKRRPNLLFKNLRMKLSLLFFMTALFSMQASSSYSQKTLSLDVENMSLERLFDEIENQTDYRFVYKTSDVDLDRQVTLKVQKEAVEDILKRIFSGSATIFTILNEQVILSKKEIPPAQFSIRGTVSDDTGMTIPGVNVVIKSSNIGTITNLDGSYVLMAGEQDTLVFSHLGFKTVEYPIAGNPQLDVTLEAEMSQLSEVVITGIYERKAESFTGASTTLSKEDLKKVGSANVFQAIQNIDPSIVMMDNFALGSNPNALPEMQVRGTSTFPGGDLGTDLKGNYLKDPNQPLFILNGFEANVEQIFDLDINRVESVTILKDAASKAIYGSKAANGVIVIETTRLSGEDVLITYNASLDMELPDLSSYNLTNSLEKLEAERIDGMYIPTGANGADQYAELQQLYNSRRKLALEGLDTDWMAKPLRNGFGQRHSLSAELGGDDLRILANLTYRNVEGAMIGSSRNTLSGSMTTSYRLDNFSFRNVTTVVSNNSEESPYGEYSEYSRMNPYWRAENPDGSIPYYSEIAPNGERYPNPLFNSTLDSKIVSEYLNVINNFYVEWNILPELKAVGRIGIDVKKNNADEFLPSQHTSFDLYAGDDINRKGSYQVNNGQSNYFSGDLNFQYAKNVNKHFYFANLGFNISERKFNEVVHKVEGFPSSRMDNILFARDYALDSRPTGIEGLSRDIGFLAVGSYSYDNRFLSDLTLRRSASSQFGADNKWADFWSLGLGWNLHNEAFLLDSAFDQLKIRGSLGSTGNQNFNTNESIATYGYFLNERYQGFPGSYVTNMANPYLQWESKFDYNGGLDLKAGNLSMRFDYYESYTENLITDITLPFSTGFNSVKDNLGKVKNIGVEADLSYLVWSRGRNYLAFNVGVATNKNEIVELSNAMKGFNQAMEEQAADRGNNKPVHKYEDGMSMDAIWAVPSKGIDPATGNEIYIDRDGNTTYEWNAQDMVVVGNDSPRYRGVVGISGEYEGFGITLTGRYLGGGQLYNQTLLDRVENVDMNYNVDKRVLTGRWLYPGHQALFKRLGNYNVPQEDGGNVSFPELTRATSRFVQDREEFDIAAINVYYEFKKDFVENLNMSRLRLSFNMNEVHKFSSIKIERGTAYPFARNMSFSLLASF